VRPSTSSTPKHWCPPNAHGSFALTRPDLSFSRTHCSRRQSMRSAHLHNGERCMLSSPHWLQQPTNAPNTRRWQPHHRTRKLREHWTEAPPTREHAERGTWLPKCSSRQLRLRQPTYRSVRSVEVSPRPSSSCTPATGARRASNFTSCSVTPSQTGSG